MPKILPEGWIPIRCHSRYKPCGYCENEAERLSVPEVWKTIPGFTDYEVSSHDRVKCHNWGANKMERITRKCQQGTYYLRTEKPNHHRFAHAHVLQEMAFGYIEPKLEPAPKTVPGAWCVSWSA